MEMTQASGAMGAGTFSDDQLEHFQDEDRQATRMIIGLMSAIFTTGLFIYSIIAYIVAS